MSNLSNKIWNYSHQNHQSINKSTRRRRPSIQFLQLISTSSSSLFDQVTLFNCIIIGFGGDSIQSGGAISLSEFLSLIVSNVTFIANKAQDGGAIGILSSKFLGIYDCYFYNNVGRYGGAININFFKQNQIFIHRSTFYNNSALSYGGGISIFSYNQNINILDCNFLNNYARSAGGAINIYLYNKNITILNTRFHQNIAQRKTQQVTTIGMGGAIMFFISNTNILISNGIFTENNAGYIGVIGFQTKNENTIIENCIFHNNTSDGDSTVLTMNDSSNSTIYNCSFLDNISPQKRPCATLLIQSSYNISIQFSNFINNFPYSLFFDDQNSNIIISDLIFHSHQGTHIYLDGIFPGYIQSSKFNGADINAIYSTIIGTLIISDCVFNLIVEH